MFDSTQVGIVEFARVKFSTKDVTSGDEYLRFVKSSIFHKVTTSCKNLQEIIVVEEKYSFTPDGMKAPCRSSRTKKKRQSIAHLKNSSDILSKNKFDRDAITSTAIGKKLISKYLASRACNLHLRLNLDVIIDSEFCIVESLVTGIVDMYPETLRFVSTTSNLKKIICS